MNTPAVELNDVSFSYNGLVILKDVALTIEPDDFLVIIGPNGGGKTTLLKLILGILTPAQGTVRVFGANPLKTVHRVGYVSQDVSVRADFPLSVSDVVLMGRLAHRNRLRRYLENDLSVVRKTLEKVDVWDKRSARISDLSVGQRQRVLIARALATEPDILLLDEPTASIDMEGQSKIYEILRDLNKAMTIVVVSHDFALTLGFAKTVAHVKRTVHVHKSLDFTPEMLNKLSESSLRHICPVELIAQGYFQMRSSSDQGRGHD